MRRRILLTGVTGFIGQALHMHLVKIGDAEVIAVSRKHGVDLTKSNWVTLLPDVEVDTVIHLAQSSRYREFPDGAEDMRRVNIDATAQLLEWARSHRVRRFIYSSSGNVYKSSTQPLTENDPTDPMSFYGATKLCAEHLVSQYRQFFNVIIARLFGIYGPGQENMLMPDIIRRLRCGEEIVLAQEKGLIFSPLYISDCVTILAKLSSSSLAARNTIINVAGSDPIQLGDVVAALEKLMGVHAVIRRTNDEPRCLVASIDRLQEMFPNLSLTKIEDGLRQLIAYHPSNV